MQFPLISRIYKVNIKLRKIVKLASNIHHNASLCVRGMDEYKRKND